MSLPAPHMSCFECARRHWVCDAAQPVCKRCRLAGIVCPGYDGCRPLTWLAPGRVSARPRRRRGSPAPMVRAKPEPAATAATSVAETRRQGLARDDGSGTALPAGEDDARVQVQRRSSLSRQMVADIPSSPQDDVLDMLEAAQYFNSKVYPYLVATALAPSPFISPIPRLEVMSASMRHILISLALGHRIQHLTDDPWPCASPTGLLPAPAPPGPTPGPVTGTAGRLRWRVHRHVGCAIRALNQEIAHESTRCTTATIFSVYMFLVAELFQSTAPQWRSHNSGFLALIQLRGGLDGLLRDEGQPIRPAVLSFVIMGVIANTTSPSHDQVAAEHYFDLMPTISELYVYIYPRLPCPVVLFLEIIRINHLRQLVAKGLLGGVVRDRDSAIPMQLRNIIGFSPEHWAAQQGSTSPQSTWLLIGRIFQSAVFIFADASLSSLRSFDEATAGPGQEVAAAATRAFHRARLLGLVRQCLASDVTRYCVLWPLIVAGFEAVRGTAAERDFVDSNLTEMRREAGAAPLVARDVLRRFWASGKGGYDECFDQPYAFLT